MIPRIAALFLLAALWLVVPTEKSVFVRLPQGLSARELSEKLSQEGVLLRKGIFLAAVNILKMDRNLKYGTYMFYTGAPLFNVITELRKGISILIKVTVPEGFRADQIAARLEAEGITTASEFSEYVSKNKLEGYLFPETYYFPPSDSPNRICEVFKAQFDKTTTELNLSSLAGAAHLTPHKALILASIIEKEAATDEEKKLISGIFHNRMKKYMRLESCSTVRYALKKWKKPLSIEDTLFESPFNTYRHRGLPPEPICNPGKEALAAAVEPVETDLLFFVLDADGKHNFSQYFEQHKNKKFRKKRTK
ncbi:endolytic transglycosylase MltG [bacterium]|nr:endolytic transglycosylase MltG [bacterium]MBU3956103.1 endolytic transglycosylase MltG [bacterium]MBU4134711.1 endolytic transglycosylase MltG [bacterium]